MGDAPDTKDAQRKPVDAHNVLDIPSGTRDFGSRQIQSETAAWFGGGLSWSSRAPSQLSCRSLCTGLRRKQREPNGGGAIVLILTAVSIGGSRVAIEIHGKRALRAGRVDRRNARWIKQRARGIGKIRRR